MKKYLFLLTISKSFSRIEYFRNVPIIKILLFPFALLYGIGVWIRNVCYNQNVFFSTSFQVPVICVGNLTAGGTGKSPMVVYLIRSLSSVARLASLSRGYGRKTKGYLEVLVDMNARETGDEPLMIKKKISNHTVAVCGNRVEGIKQILDRHPEVQGIVLDDAYQHRKVKPSLSILLMDYSQIFKPQYLLPYGKLREGMSGKKRADVIVITKCPAMMSPMEQRRYSDKVKPNSNQKIFFSGIQYGEMISVNDSVQVPSPSNEYYFSRQYSVLLFTGIADPQHLINFLEEKKMKVYPTVFPDHHEFQQEDIQKITKSFSNITDKNKIILTTQKDYTRLLHTGLIEMFGGIPVFYIPIEIKFDEKQKEEFHSILKSHIESFKP